ncbi:activator-dependent family glycosyltransferase [Nocardiopsis sp. NPDC007018]|uniref:activator-dependent family glycosyltransferase n=1 Tax=Nocardiopsis sp. NPDC007018 TaxID=3155721 RepID=UPI0033C2672F
MRILFATYSEKTHFFSMVPLAWALRTAGHEVRVASQPEIVDTITSTGLTAVSVGQDHSVNRILEAFPRLQERVADGQLDPFIRADEPEEDLSWEYVRDNYDSVVLSWFRLMNNPMLDDLVSFCRSWRPDLVIWEPGTFAAPIAAKACGAAHARLMWCVDFYGRMREMYVRRRRVEQGPDGPPDSLARWMDHSARRYGVRFDEEMTRGQFTIDQLPPSMHMDTGVDRYPVRYTAYNGRSVIPEWLRAPAGDRPRVCLTLGVTATERLSGYSVSVPEILDSLSGMDAEIIATVAEKEQRRLGPLPDNVRVERFVPLQALLPTCDAVIHHGGFGTTFTTLVSGVPQVSIPQQLDTPFTARRIAARGASIHLDKREATGERVRASVERVLTDPSYARNSRLLRDEILAQPSPNEFAEGVEELVRRYRTSPGRRTADLSGRP